MKKTFLKAAIPTLAMLLVAVMALTGTTYAWFTNNNQATATGIDVTITSAGGLLLSVDEKATWASSVDLNMEEHNLQAVSTNGVSTGGSLSFYTATLSKTDNSKLAANSITAAPNASSAGKGYWLKKSLWIKNESTSPVTVTLEGTSMTGSGAVAGRIGLYDANTKVMIFSDDGADTYGLTGEQITTDTAVTATTGTHVAKYTTTNSGSGVSISLGGSAEKNLTVYFWLEGQDPQCTNTIAEQEIHASLKFKGPTAS